MKKIMTYITPCISLACLAGTVFVVMESRKNILDVIIEEIETIK